MRQGIALFAFLGLVLLPAVTLAAEDAEACANAFEAAQLHRRESSWARARVELASCERTCPAELRRDCARWAEELEREKPVVELSARDEQGRTLEQVKVLVNGEARSDASHRPVALDPGRYVIRFVHPDRRSIEQTVTLRPKERREVVVVFASPAAPRPSRAPENDTQSVVPWVLTGVGAAAVGVGIALGIKGRLDLDELERTCAPNCNEEQADDVRRTWVAGAVVGAAGGALLVTSIVLHLGSDGGNRERGARLTTTAHGFGPALRWRF